jgi:hypothetical protein
MIASHMKSNIRIRMAAGATTLALATILPAGVAQAEWWYTKAGAQKIAIDYVSRHYADTYAGDLAAECEPDGLRRADPRYKYHRWVCGWYDSSDDTAGGVLIKGSVTVGGYYGSVIVGAHRA